MNDNAIETASCDYDSLNQSIEMTHDDGTVEVVHGYHINWDIWTIYGVSTRRAQKRHRAYHQAWVEFTGTGEMSRDAFDKALRLILKTREYNYDHVLVTASDAELRRLEAALVEAGRSHEATTITLLLVDL